MPELASRNSKRIRSKPKPPPRRTHRATLAASPSPSELLRLASTAEASSISRRIHCSTALSPSPSLGFCETSWPLLARLCWERRSSRSIPAPVIIAATSTEFQGQRSTHTARASRSTSPRSCSRIGGALRLGMRQVPKRLCSCKRYGARAAGGSRPYWGRVTQITPTISTSTSYATVRPTTIGSANSRLPPRPRRTKMRATPLRPVCAAYSAAGHKAICVSEPHPSPGSCRIGPHSGMHQSLADGHPFAMRKSGSALSEITSRAFCKSLPSSFSAIWSGVRLYARHLACAVRRRRFPVGASPTRRTLQPEATGAVMEVTKWLKPSV
jgi:hypothetical protein